ncbi:MAG: ribonuclease III [Alphaproteobacteria bacterium]
MIIDHSFEEMVGYQFRNPSLLQEALTHSSLAKKGRRKPVLLHNERLEFLGDRVLGLLVADLLIGLYPEWTEGQLARVLAQMVSRESLTVVAAQIGIAPFLRLGDSENAAGARMQPGVLANAVEALIGALYKDGGLETARVFVRCYWQNIANNAHMAEADVKSALQDFSLKRVLGLPVYETIGEYGTPHAPLFAVSVTITGFPPAKGEGKTKKIAEKRAAAAFLRERGITQGWRDDTGE